MSSALRKVNFRNAPVTTKVREDQVKNNTGGFVFNVSDKARLERFLILGTDGGTYYVGEKDLTQQNVDWLQKLIRNEPGMVLNTVLDVSLSGRAYRNSAALFVLAMILNYAPEGSSFRRMAADHAPTIARTATHLFELAQYIENLGGWGRSKRRAVANWFTTKDADSLAYQAVKYRQRNGWTLRDAMRLSHPVGVDKNVGNFILGKFEDRSRAPGILQGFTAMQNASGLINVIHILDIYQNLPWETIPTQFLKSPEVWKTLFANGQLKGQALVRNVVRLARIGAFDDLRFAGQYAKALTDENMIQKTRLHPMAYLMASITYADGQVDRNSSWEMHRNKNWNTTPAISSALKDGFYKSFKYAEPSNARTLIGVDVSGSMSWSSAVGSDLSAAQAAAAMSMVTARLEPFTQVMGFAREVKDLGISPDMSFSEIMKKTSNMTFGSTNPSALIEYAKNRRMEIDTFLVITDNEVNTGYHVHQTLRDYRNSVNKNAKLAVMAVTSTGFTIADPSDRGMLDVVGFDSNAPKVVADFSRGDF